MKWNCEKRVEWGNLGKHERASMVVFVLVGALLLVAKLREI